MFGWLRSLRSDRYVRIGCVALHALRSLRCVRCIQIVTYTSGLLCSVGYVRCIALRWFHMFGSGRYVPNGCVASVAFVPFTSFRSERNDVNASNVSHRLCWLVCVRCKPFIQQPHHPVSVKDCQKKLNQRNQRNEWLQTPTHGSHTALARFPSRKPGYLPEKPGFWPKRLFCL